MLPLPPALTFDTDAKLLVEDVAALALFGAEATARRSLREAASKALAWSLTVTPEEVARAVVALGQSEG